MLSSAFRGAHASAIMDKQCYKMLKLLEDASMHIANSMCRKLGSPKQQLRSTNLHASFFTDYPEPYRQQTMTKKQLIPNQSSWEFFLWIFQHTWQIFQQPNFFQHSYFFWPSFKKPLYNLQPRIFLSSFLFTSLNLFSLELLDYLYLLLLYYNMPKSIHHLHYMLIFFALS